MDRVSIERMCTGREFQAEGADAEKVREEKLLVISAGLVRRFVLDEHKDLGGSRCAVGLISTRIMDCVKIKKKINQLYRRAYRSTHL